MLGAGLDTFAYRNPHDGLHVFEVDHPATQAWKREQLQTAGITIPSSLTFVPIDFEQQTLEAELKRSSFNANSAAFFSWLGVTPYLTREACMTTLSLIAKMPAAHVPMDAGVHDAAEDAKDAGHEESDAHGDATADASQGDATPDAHATPDADPSGDSSTTSSADAPVD